MEAFDGGSLAVWDDEILWHVDRLRHGNTRSTCRHDAQYGGPEHCERALTVVFRLPMLRMPGSKRHRTDLPRARARPEKPTRVGISRAGDQRRVRHAVWRGR
jgi:hypothetical protein